MSETLHHKNIPIFIPHLGCPNSCVFCDQRSISGKHEFVREKVEEEIETALKTMRFSDDTEIAFFGGSFTGIERELMIYLLDLAQKYINEGRVKSIRLSTRPDYISREILNILSGYSIGTVELGLQSMDDMVLKACKRGHDSRTAENACKMIKEAGYKLVGQMMIGLPAATSQSEISTAKKICELGANAARVYPTVVFYRTELCEMAQNHLYTPLTEHDAVMRTKDVLKVFAECNIPCIRVGLCASENLSDAKSVYGGANHSAIGELAMGELFYEVIKKELENAIDKNLSMITNDNYHANINSDRIAVVYVPPGSVSKACGQRKINKIRLKELFKLKDIKFRELPAISGYNVIVKINTLQGGTACI